MTNLRLFSPADHDWVVDNHAHLYAKYDGFDATFGPLVNNILAEFSANHDPNCEQGWIAMNGQTRVGSIFCVKGEGGYAKLRLFLVLPPMRGTGLGAKMLSNLTDFAKSKSYRGMRLWTHESHVAACSLYSKTGFACVASTPVYNFGKNLVEQTWEKTF